jgi:hypothetical protein
MSAISGKVGAVYTQTTASSSAFTDEATTDKGDGLTFEIDDSTKRYWDKDTAVSVSVNATPVTTGFSIEYAGGRIVFDSDQSGNTVIVSGASFTVSQTAGFFNWSLSKSADMPECTTFGSGGNKEYQPTLNSFIASAEMFWQDEDFTDRLGDDIIVVLYTDTGVALTRYEGFARISSDNISQNVNELIQESIEFQGNGKVYFREG